MAGHFAVRRAERGFTLLEVMVALAILAVALTAIISSQSRTVSIADANDFARVSAYLAETKMGELAHGGPDRAATGSFAKPFDGYAWRADISNPPESEIGSVTVPAGLERITLEITDTRRDRTFTLRSYRFGTEER